MSKRLEKVAVNGSGILGAQIAMMAVYGGCKVKVFDPLRTLFGNLQQIKERFEFQENYPFIPWDQWEDANHRSGRPPAWMKL